MNGTRRDLLPPCECCGLRAELAEVPVVSRTGEMRAVFELCERCARDSNRAWRLSWIPEGDAA